MRRLRTCFGYRTRLKNIKIKVPHAFLVQTTMFIRAGYGLCFAFDMTLCYTSFVFKATRRAQSNYLWIRQTARTIKTMSTEFGTETSIFKDTKA